MPTRELGVGVYSVPEAARLTGVSAPRIRRWLHGYSFGRGEARRTSARVWAPQFEELEGRLALGFRDLLEVRFVDAFLQKGVSWPVLRGSSERAAELFDVTHPFSTRRFKTDGRSIFLETVNELGEPSVLDLLRNQYAFAQVVAPYLEGLEFSKADEPLRWWPLRTRRVVIDPQRAFGQPIVTDGSVPTAILARALKAEKSVSRVARLYEVAEASVKAAVQFETQRAA